MKRQIHSMWSEQTKSVAQKNKAHIPLCTSQISPKMCLPCLIIMQSCCCDCRINKTFVCSRCLICVLDSGHFISTYYARKGLLAFLIVIIHKSTRWEIRSHRYWSLLGTVYYSSLLIPPWYSILFIGWRAFQCLENSSTHFRGRLRNSATIGKGPCWPLFLFGSQIKNKNTTR